ncbi:MAG: STAS/SEC14 domain-containing protein [Chthoniobacterales bacterium]
MHKIISENGNLIQVRVSQKLTQADYDDLIPRWEASIAREGSTRLLLLMEDFHGWDLRAAWDDFRFEARHAAKVERVALVGDQSWEKWMTKLGSFFVDDQVKYFDAAQIQEA